MASIAGNEGGITQAWVNARGGMRMLAASFWHTEDGPQEMKLGSSAEESLGHKTTMAGARKVHRTKNTCRKSWQMGKASPWRS